MNRSLKSRLLWGVFLSTLVIFILSGLGLHALLRHALLAEFDAALDAKAGSIISMIEQGKQGIKLDLDPSLLPDFRREDHPDYFILTDSNQNRVADSEAVGGGHRLSGRELRTASKTGVEATTHTFVDLPNGQHGRMVRITFIPRRDDEDRPSVSLRSAILAFARDTHALNRQFNRLAWVLIGVFSGTILVLTVALIWVIRLGLRPMDALADRIHDIGTNNLSDRIAPDQSPTEMRPVVRRLNELLANVESNLARERQFTADVAHELRTPLSGLTTVLQVCLSQSRAASEYPQVLNQCLDVTQNMSSLVENLLTLAHADAEDFHPTREVLNLIPLLRDTWKAFDSRVAGRKLSISWKSPESLVVKTDPAILAIVLRNVFDNAVSYCNFGGVIEIRVEITALYVIVNVANTGSLVAAADVSKVFDRFWRGDRARSVSGHYGLGLTLCSRVIALLGATIDATSKTGGWFTIAITLPVGIPSQSQ